MPAYEHYTDEQLAAAARDEDMEAWEALIRRHGQRLLAFYVRMCGEEALARELWLQGWGELWRQRGALASGGRPASAAFAQATRSCLKVSPPPLKQLPLAEPRSLEARALRLRQALSALPARQRAALCLCYFDSLSFEDAGRCLGTGPGEAKQLCAEAYAALMRGLGGRFLLEGLG